MRLDCVEREKKGYKCLAADAGSQNHVLACDSPLNRMRKITRRATNLGRTGPGIMSKRGRQR